MDKKKRKISSLLASAVALTVGGSVVAQACANTGNVVPDPGENAQVAAVRLALLDLNSLSSIPQSSTNAGVVLNEIIRSFTLNGSAVSDITAINISNPETSIVTNSLENFVTVAANSITVDTIGSSFQTYTNTESLIITQILVVNEQIRDITISRNVFEPQITARELLEETLINLITQFDSAFPPTDLNELQLLAPLIRQIESLAGNFSSVQILSINLLVANSEIQNFIEVSEDSTSITIARGILSINTNIPEISVLQNSNADFVMSGIIVNGTNITTNGSTTVSGLLPVYSSTQTILSSVRNLDGATTVPSDSNAAVFFNVFLNALKIVDANISEITNISISNINTFITTNTSGTEAYISAGSISFQTVGGSFENYRNPNSEIVISDIDVDITTGLIIGTPQIANPTSNILAQPLNNEVILNAVNGLNGATERPSVPSQSVLWDSLLNAVKLIDTSVTNVSLITILDAESDSVFSDGAGNFAGILQNRLSILTIDGTNSNNFSNSLSIVTMANVEISNNAITSIGVVSGIEPTPSEEDIIANFGRALDGISNVPTNISLSHLYFTILERIRLVSPEVKNITSINISNPLTSVSSTSSTLVFAQDSLSVSTDSPIVSTFVNSDNAFVVDIMLDSTGSAISMSSSTSTMIPSPTRTENIINSGRSLVDITGIPSPSNVSQSALYNGILNRLKDVDETITTITQISISLPLTSVTASPTSLSFAANSLFVFTDSEYSRIYTNFNQAFVLNITSNGGGDIISQASSSSEINQLPTLTEVNKNFGVFLNGISGIPENSSLNNLYQVLLNRLRNFDSSITLIDSITISEPFDSVSSTNSSITFAQNSLTITTNGIRVRTYQNTDNSFVITTTLNSAGNSIMTASTTSFINQTPTNAEVVTNAFVDWAQDQIVNPVLENLLFETAESLNISGFELSSVTLGISLEAGRALRNILQVTEDGSSITLPAPSFILTIFSTSPGLLVLFSNDPPGASPVVDFVISGIVVENFEIISASTISGLFFIGAGG